MAFKLVNATEIRIGNFAIINDAPCIIKSMDISKTGKHGHAKVRIEAMGIIDGKKKIIVVPGTERITIPMIEKRKAQVLKTDKTVNKATVMDLENYETFDVDIAPDIAEEIDENKEVEYWNVEGKKIIKKIT